MLRFREPSPFAILRAPASTLNKANMTSVCRLCLKFALFLQSLGQGLGFRVSGLGFELWKSSSRPRKAHLNSRCTSHRAMPAARYPIRFRPYIAIPQGLNRQGGGVQQKVTVQCAAEYGYRGCRACLSSAEHCCYHYKLVMLTSILGVLEGSRCGLNDPRKRVILPWYLVTGDAAPSNDRNLELPLSV